MHLRKPCESCEKDVLVFINFITITGSQCHALLYNKHLWNIYYNLDTVLGLLLGLSVFKNTLPLIASRQE